MNFKKSTVRFTEGDEGGSEIVKQTRRTLSPYAHPETDIYTCGPSATPNEESGDLVVKQLYTGDSEGVLRGLSSPFS